jgi:hypothetical protein
MAEPSDVRFSERMCNGVKLHVAEAGPEAGPLVILLHGFPEFCSAGASNLARPARLSRRDADQRGYNQRQTAGIASYDVDKISADAGAQRAPHLAPFRLVGHDWGAVAAWWNATTSEKPHAWFSTLPHPASGVMRWRTIPNSAKPVGMCASCTTLAAGVLLRSRLRALVGTIGVHQASGVDAKSNHTAG